MYLRALSIGYAVPDGNFAASIHSVFRSALNLRLDGENHLLTLIASGEGDLPQGIRLNAPDSFSFEDFRLGELVICRNGILHFEGNSLNVQLSEARRWKCDLSALRFDPADPVVFAAWSFVWEMLNGQQRLSEAEILAEELVRSIESPRAGAPRKAGEAMHDLLHATRRYDSTYTSSVAALIGLGSGLTPSGDDLLVGYLTGLWCTARGGSERMQFIASLGKTIIDLSSQTNDISRTYLYHAVHGQVSNQLANLAEGICREEDRQHLGEVAAAAFKVGHTSGMDAAAGLLVGLTAWTSPGTFHF